MKNVSKALFMGVCLFAAACTQQQDSLTRSGLNPQDFQTEVNGKQTQLYTLTNANGIEVSVPDDIKSFNY